MKRFLAAIVLLCLIVPCWAGWQSRDSNYNVAIASGASAPSLDGSAKSSVSGTGTNTLTLTTTNSNDQIIVFVAVNGCGGGVDTAVVTSAHLTFVLRSHTQTAHPNCTGGDFMEFDAQAGSPLTSEVITLSITPGAGINYSEMLGFGVNGINTGAPFDTNVSLPAHATSGALSISTSHAADFIFAGFRAGGPPTPDAGWTTIINGSFIGAEFQRVSSTQSGLAAGGSNGNSGGIGDAIVSP